MILPVELIHSVFNTLTRSGRCATEHTCDILSPGCEDCSNCIAKLPKSSRYHNCGFDDIDNHDYASSLQAYFELYPEQAI